MLEMLYVNVRSKVVKAGTHTNVNIGSSVCIGANPTRASLGISFDTLANESPDNIIHIARFDTWL
jgi:hypothetical protein